jgi:hypothetical protein
VTCTTCALMPSGCHCSFPLLSFLIHALHCPTTHCPTIHQATADHCPTNHCRKKSFHRNACTKIAFAKKKLQRTSCKEMRARKSCKGKFALAPRVHYCTAAWPPPLYMKPRPRRSAHSTVLARGPLPMALPRRSPPRPRTIFF